jgi:hypothetical protein
MSGTALLVGGMQSRVDVLQRALVQLGWQVTPFLNPREAIESLGNTSYEALFCDDQLRGASASGLLVYARRMLPDLPFYLFSNDHDPGRFRLSGEPTSVFHFPPVLAQLPAPRDTPHPELTGQRLDAPLSGNTALVPLAELIEMMGVAKQQGVIELGYGKDGMVVVGRGRLEHAVATIDGAQRTGLQALSSLLQLPESAFQVAAYRPPPRMTVNLTIATALTEAARLADETRRFAALAGEVQALCPEARAVAVGGTDHGAPFQGLGDVPELSKNARALLESHRAILGGVLQDALLVVGDRVLVLNVFGEGRLLAAEAPASARAKLYRAVQSAIKGLSE